MNSVDFIYYNIISLARGLFARVIAGLGRGVGNRFCDVGCGQFGGLPLLITSA